MLDRRLLSSANSIMMANAACLSERRSAKELSALVSIQPQPYVATMLG